MQRGISALAVGALAVSLAIPVHAQEGPQGPTQAKEKSQDEEKKREERIEQLEKKIDVLSQEIEGMRREALVSEEYEYKPSRRLGPAGSKIYSRKGPGVTIAGYGQGFFNFSDEQTDHANLLRQIVYVGHRFNDWIVFNSEIEFETKGEVEGEARGQSVDPIPTEEGEAGEIEREFEAAVEFAYLDFLLDRRANIRAGLVLLPLGFINEVHEPPTFFGNRRPPVETEIIPSTTRENGVGIYGNLFAGTLANMEYTLYAMNSFDARGLSSAGLNGVRQNGAAIAEDLAVTGSLEWKPIFGLTLAGDFWTGDMAQGSGFAGKDVRMTLFDLRAQYRYRGLRLRGLFTQANINNVSAVNRELQEEDEELDAIGDEMRGWYVEAAYNIMPWIADLPQQWLSPWFRYSSLDTQRGVPTSIVNDPSGNFTTNPTNDRQVIAAGLDYKPIPNVAIKADYRNFDFDGQADDENQFLVGLGYYF